MSLTKAQARTLIREWLDDPSAKRWSDGNIDLATTLVLDDLWSDMLDIAPYLTSQLQTITSLSSPGYVDLRLATQGGDLTQRFYRIQQVIRGDTYLTPRDPRDTVIVNNATIVHNSDTFHFVGDQMWLFPLDTTSKVELRYSFRPTAFSSLTNGNNVTFPEGSESAYVLGTAALTMAKGNVEDVGQLASLATLAKERLINSIRRQYHGPTVPYTTEGAQSYGGI